MRVAWLGATPDDDAGVPYVATQLLRELARAGVDIDCFVTGTKAELPATLQREPNISFTCIRPRWEDGRVYSRTPLLKFVTGQTARALAQLRLIALVAKRHAARPYDVLYQFSQIEMLGVGLLRRRLPPIVLHPEVHAAGELRWHRREQKIAAGCETRVRHLGVRAMLAVRAASQGRYTRRARLLIAPSRRFAEHVAADYGIALGRTRVVANPVDMERFAPRPAEARSASAPLNILFVSRMSVRKGVEMVIALSHRLADLAGRVSICVVGDCSLWSDYRPLLGSLHASVADYHGPATPAQLPALYRSADLLVQPSHYEPFGLTVAEGLASGVPVVASDEVGAVEEVDPRCCRRFAAGNLDAFESAVREAYRRFREDGHAGVSATARAEAERLFAPSVVARRVASYLEGAIAMGECA